MKIKKSKIAIFSDLHLGIHYDSSVWHSISEEWIDWFIKKLKREKITDVIFCGDWFHSRNEIDVITLNVSNKIINKFTDFNIHMIVGNHDIPYKNSTEVTSIEQLENLPNVRVYKNTTYVECFDRKICFVPWGNSIDSIDNCDVIFGHLEINSFKQTVVKRCTSGISVSDLLNKSELVFSGHFHIRKEKKYSEGSIVYVGNPFQMDFNDIHNKKGFYILDLDNLQYDFVESSVSITHIKVTLSDFLEKGPDFFINLCNGNYGVINLLIDIKATDRQVEEAALALSGYEKCITFKTEFIDVDYKLDVKIDKTDVIDIENIITEFVRGSNTKHKKESERYLKKLYRKCNEKN